MSELDKKVKKKSSRKEKHRKKSDATQGKRIKILHTIRFRFSFAIFVLFAITGATTALLFLLLRLITFFEALYLNIYLLVIAMALACIIIGTAVSAASSKIWLGRITKISHGMREIAKGNFATRVNEKDKESSITELGELERTFNQMAADLEGIEFFRNDFINNFSHEFKTPIVSIRGFAHQLQSGNLSDEQRKEYIDIIVSESNRLANMSQNVLLLSKLEYLNIVTEKTEFQLDEQIRTSVLLLEKDWSAKNIDLDIDLDEVKYVFNVEMMSHIWINLFSNAIKFSREGGRISLSLKKLDDYVEFKISDEGVGMSEEVKSRIFEKFYQGDSSHSSAGNGIGLNIVQRIVTLAGGSIAVESEADKGSTFTVLLPQGRKNR